MHVPVEVARPQSRRGRWRTLGVVSIACVAGAAPDVAGRRHRPAEVLRAE